MILSTLMRGFSRLTTSNDWRWWQGQGFGASNRRTAAGVPIDENSAMTLSAVYRAISILAETSSALPLELFRSGDAGERMRVPDHPAQELIEQPNPLMDGMTFRENMTSQLVGRGNAYAEIVWGIGSDERFRPVSAWPIPTEHVKPKLYPKSIEKYYEVTRPDGSKVILEAEECLHLRGKGDNLEGWSTLRLARESIGLGVGAERHGAAQFGSGNKPAGIMKFPRKPAQEAIDTFKKNWNNDHQGPENASKVGFIWGEGVDWVSTSMSNEDAQFLQTRQFQVLEIARFFGIAPHLLFDLSRATHSNIEQQSIEFLMYGLSYWLTKWEMTLACALLLPDEQEELLFEHCVQKLLRTDIKTRYDVYAIARQWGIQSGNDIRRAENIAPRPDADELVLPSGTVRSGHLPDGSAGAPAPAKGAAPAKSAPAPPPEPEPDGGEDYESPLDVRRAWASSELGRLFRKEVLAVGRFAKAPASFLEKIEEFYGHHRKLCADALRQIGVAGDAGELAEKLCSASFAELLELSGTVSPAKLEAEVTKLVQGWPDRAAAFAKELVP